MFSLKPPRHISTLPKPEVTIGVGHVRSTKADVRHATGKRLVPALFRIG